MPSKASSKRKSATTKKKPVAKKVAPTRSKTSKPVAAKAKKPVTVSKSSKPAPKPTSKPAPKTEAPVVPNAMGLQIAHVDFTTHNFDEVRRFYTQQMGFTKFDFDSQFHYLMVHTTNSSSLGFAPPPPGYNLPQPPREPTLYFLVRDINEAYRKLMARGVSFEAPPEMMPWGHRVVRTRDPEGRAIWIAQMVRREK